MRLVIFRLRQLTPDAAVLWHDSLVAKRAVEGNTIVYIERLRGRVMPLVLPHHDRNKAVCSE